MGFVMIVGLMLMFTIGLYYTRPLVQLLSFVLALFFIVAMIQSNQNLSGLRVLSLRGKPSAAQSPAYFTARILNESEEPKFLIQARLKGFKHVEIPILLKQQEVEVGFELKTQERGVSTLPWVELTSIFPIGFFRTWSRKKFDGEFIVYPVPRGASVLPSQVDLDGDPFRGHRKHLRGESEKTIDWKAHARGSKRLVKEFEPETRSEEHLCWSDLEALEPEEKLSQLCLWALKANEAQKSFSLELPNQLLPLGRSDEHTRRALKMLAEYLV